MRPTIIDDKMKIAISAMQGMLAHPTRYKLRGEDIGKHWHNAIVAEAFDIADVMIREQKSRARSAE